MRSPSTVWIGSAVGALFLCAHMIPVTAAQAQALGDVSGRVVSEAGTPLAGASASVDGTQLSAITGADGLYTIRGVEPGQRTVRVAIIGYGEATVVATVAAGVETTVDFELSPQAIALEGLVAVGYGEQRLRDLTGSVASVRVEEVPLATTPSVGQMLRGRAAGAQVVQNNGAPGGGVSVRIRGTNSITANSEPLYVIDGVPSYVGTSSQNPNANPLSAISPQDIESIEVLKDASATAIYGARGSSGVVLITTRQGRRGEGQVRLESSYGVQEPTRYLPLLGARDYAELANLARENVGMDPVFSREEVAAMGAGTDWQREVMASTPLQNHTLSFSGGDESTRYLFSGSYFEQGGIIRNSSFERFSGRMNVDRTVNDRLQVGVNLLLSRTVRGAQFTDELNPGPTDGMITTPPTFAVRDDDGRFTVLPRGNPVAAQDELRRNTESTATGNVFGELEIAEGLQFRSSFGVTAQFGRGDFFQPTTTPAGQVSGGNASVSSSEDINLISENILTHQRELGPGGLDVTAGVTWQDFRGRFVSAGASDFATDLTGVNDIGAGAQISTPGSGVDEWTLVSNLARLNYSLFDRYLFTLTGRYDGSSRFGENRKWGFFPSGAFAWRVIDEPFMQEQRTFSDLKLRFSYGRTGNQEIGLFQSLERLSTVSTTFGDARVIGFAPAGAAPNPDLKWESTSQVNLGFDAGWLDNRVTASVDVYRSVTDDLLLSVELPFTSGFTSQLRNIGSVRNHGVELSLSTINVERSDFQWRSTLSLAANRNKVLDLGGVDEMIVGSQKGLGGQTGSGVGLIRVGEPLGNILGFRTDGLFQEGDACHVEAPEQHVDCVPGEYVYLDTSGDGRISNADRVILGNAEPDFHGGLTNTFRYGRFDLNVFLQAAFGNDVFNGMAINTMRLAGDMNQTTAALNHWTAENTNTSVPRPNFNRPRRVLDLHVEDGSYLRLQNVTVGYEVPERLIPGASAARVYATGENLHVWTSYTGYDPEVNSFGGDPAMRGIDLGAFPRARSWSFGLNVSF